MKQKGEKTRLTEQPKQPDQTPAPYLGHPETPDQTPPPAANPPAPAPDAAVMPAMKEIYVADLGKFENQAIVAFFAVTTRQLRSRKDGGQYLALTLGDRTGQVESRMWG